MILGSNIFSIIYQAPGDLFYIHETIFIFKIHFYSIKTIWKPFCEIQKSFPSVKLIFLEQSLFFS